MYVYSFRRNHKQSNKQQATQINGGVDDDGIDGRCRCV